MARTLLTFIDSAPGAAPGGRWCYLGKNAARRAELANHLGEGSRFFLGARLSDAAAMARTPFLDYMARLGEAQPDRLRWWSTLFATRSPFQVDFFLLLSYGLLVDGLVEEVDGGDEDLIVVVEDPWLFAALKERHREIGTVESGPDPAFFMRRLKLALRGAAYRVAFFGWLVLNYILLKLHFKEDEFSNGVSGGEGIAIYGHGEKKAMRGGVFAELYMHGLAELIDSLYEGSRRHTFHLWDLLSPIGSAADVGRNSGVLWPIAVDTPLGEAFGVVFESWRPELPAWSDKVEVGRSAFPVERLLEREVAVERSSIAFNSHLVIYGTLKRFFRRRLCSTVIYAFENQSYEKILCMAAKAAGVTTVGCQHAATWSLYLSQFLGRGESDVMPLPDTLMAMGEKFEEMFKDGGYPEDIVSTGGAFRFKHLAGASTGASGGEGADRVRKGPRTVLVALSVDVDISASLMESVIGEASSGRHEGVTWLIKTHPGVPLDQLGYTGPVEELAEGMELYEGDFTDALERSSVVVTSASTSGLEAFSFGKKVVSYLPDNLLGADPLLDAVSDDILVWYEGEGLDRVFLEGTGTFGSAAAEGFFAAVDDGAWRRCLGVEKG